MKYWIKNFFGNQAANQMSDLLHELSKRASDTQESFTGYVPTLGDAISFLVIFSLLLMIHVPTSLYYRQFMFFYLWGMGLALEILGYAGRVWYHENISSINAFIIQLVCVSVGPSLFMSSIYYLYFVLCKIFGREYSILSPSQFLRFFIGCNLVSIVLQATGGSLADTDTIEGRSTKTDLDLIVAGYSLQVALIVLFQVIWYSFLFNIHKEKKISGDSKFEPRYAEVRTRKLLYFHMMGVSVILLLILARNIYKVIEMKDGYTSKLATDETYTLIFDGVLMALAGCIMAAFSPCYAFRRCFASKGHEDEEAKTQNDYSMKYSLEVEDDSSRVPEEQSDEAKPFQMRRGPPLTVFLVNNISKGIFKLTH